MNLPAPPSSAPASDLTTMLHAWRQGSGTAFAGVLEQVYDQLRAIAAKRVAQGGGTATLSPTELVHEALLGLMPAPMEFKNRVHFLATMSLAIRSILVDRARARATDKRGGNLIRVTLTNVDVPAETSIIDLLAIDEALTKLEALDPRCGQVMHLTYFGGMSQDEVAAMLDISVATVTRDLRFAHGWFAKSFAADS